MKKAAGRMGRKRTSEKARMFRALMMLAMEANQVVGLRMMKLMQGGKRARREAELMVSEKMDAALQTGLSLVAGASGEQIIRWYRRRVAANAKRLAKPSTGRALKATRRRRR